MLRNWFRSKQNRSGRSRPKRALESKLSFEHLETKSLLTTLVVDINDPTADQPGDNLYGQIQEAVDAAEEGDVIKVHSGTYDPFYVKKSNLTIREARRNSDPIIHNRTGASRRFTESAGVFIASRNVTVKGLNVVNDFSDPSSQSSGFHISGSDHNIVDNTSINGRIGFYVPGGLFGGQHKLARNTSKDAHFAGFQFVGGEDNLVSSNTSEGSEFGFSLFNTRSSTLMHNKAIHNKYGFLMGALNPHPLAGSNMLIRNIASSNEMSGFLIKSTHDVLRHNVAIGNGGNGFTISGTGVTLIRNRALFNEGDGFFVSGNDHKVENNRAVGNDGWGIYVDAVLDTEFHGNRCFFNTLGSSNEPEACSHRFLFFFT